MQESEHIFIDAGLRRCALNNISVLEIGFGTGLNTYLTLLESLKEGKTIEYTSLELYPVSLSMAEALNFPARRGYKEYFDQIHSCPWNERVEITDRFFLTKLQVDFTTMETLPAFDVCYFDAFSPDKQPEMWQKDRFDLLYRSANQGATLTTYCAKGQVRRDMQQAGFKVERLPGPKGKREILRATK